MGLIQLPALVDVSSVGLVLFTSTLVSHVLVLIHGYLDSWSSLTVLACGLFPFLPQPMGIVALIVFLKVKSDRHSSIQKLLCNLLLKY